MFHIEKDDSMSNIKCTFTRHVHHKRNYGICEQYDLKEIEEKKQRFVSFYQSLRKNKHTINLIMFSHVFSFSSQNYSKDHFHDDEIFLQDLIFQLDTIAVNDMHKTHIIEIQSYFC